MINNLVRACIFGIVSMLALAQSSGLRVERLDPSTTFIEEDTLPIDVAAQGLVAYINSEMETAANSIADTNAIRMLAFPTQPGERITFSLKSDRSKVKLAVYPDPHAPRIKGAFRAANMPLESSRARRLVFTNNSKEPYEMVLCMYGTHGYKYHLSWERTPPKK